MTIQALKFFCLLLHFDHICTGIVDVKAREDVKSLKVRALETTSIKKTTYKENLPIILEEMHF